MNGVEQIVKDKTLTFEQKVVSLARFAENYVMQGLSVIYLKETSLTDHDISFLTMKSS